MRLKVARRTGMMCVIGGGVVVGWAVPVGNQVAVTVDFILG